MVKKTEITVIDSNVFIIDLRYRDDKHFAVNQRFLKSIASSGGGVTTLVNLLEITGILSFNLNARQLAELYRYFPQKYSIEVIPALTADAHLPEIEINRLMDVMARKASFGDALIMATLETYIPHASCFVTWDKQHFKGKLNMEVLTPAEYLKRG